MPNKLPRNYQRVKIIPPEITSCSGVLLYWMAIAIFGIIYFLIPLLMTEKQISGVNKFEKPIHLLTSKDELWIIAVIIFWLLCLWILRQAIRRTIMSFFGAHKFSADRVVSDVRILGEKQYIPRVLITYWAVEFYFSQIQYLLIVSAPSLLVTMLLISSASVVSRTNINFIYILFLFLFQGFALVSDLFLAGHILWHPQDSWFRDSPDGLQIYSISSEEVNSE